MKRSTVIGLIAGIGLIGIVLFKNVYRLNERIEKDQSELRTFENTLLTIQFPRNATRERDTTYLKTGELFNTVEVVAGSLSKHGHIIRYSISVATYSEELTTTESFHLDTLKRNLHQRYNDSDLKLLSIDDIEIQGIRGFRYVGRTKQHFEKTVMFTLDNNLIAINTRGMDSVDIVFEDMIKSVKIKTLQAYDACLVNLAKY
jgi:hypothetical protein